MGTDDIGLNAKAYIDFMNIEGSPILHMLHDETHLSTTQFLEPLTSKPVGGTILSLWETVNTGLPNTLVLMVVRISEIL